MAILNHSFLNPFKFLKSSLFLGLLFTSSLFLGQQVTIKGLAPEYKEKYVSVFEITDHLSQDKKLLGSTVVKDDGSFELKFENKKTQIVEILCHRNVGHLAVLPNETYHIVFPLPHKKTARRFANTPIEIKLREGTESKINEDIIDFNLEYDRFKNEYSFAVLKKLSSGSSYRNSRKEELTSTGLGKHSEELSELEMDHLESFQSAVDAFKSEMKIRFGKSMESNRYFDQYVKSSLAILDLTAGKSRETLHHEFIKNLDFSHPIQSDLFATFYNGLLFEKTKTKGPQVVDIINNNVSYTTLDSLIQGMKYLGNPNIRPYAILYQIKENLYRHEVKMGSIHNLLVELKASDDPQVKLMSENLIKQILKGKKGSDIPDFKLLNEKNEFIHLSDFRGKFVYLGFYAEWCQSCIEELQLLEKLHDSYGNDIEFINISMDDNYQSFRDHLVQNRKQNWTFLYGASDPELMANFDIRNVPTYLLIDPNGKLYQEYTKTPSEGIHMDFSELMMKLKKGNRKRTKVWDD